MHMYVTPHAAITIVYRFKIQRIQKKLLVPARTNSDFKAHVNKTNKSRAKFSDVQTAYSGSVLTTTSQGTKHSEEPAHEYKTMCAGRITYVRTCTHVVGMSISELSFDEVRNK